MADGSVLRANSRLRTALGTEGTAFLQHAAGSFERLLPHCAVDRWTEGPWGDTSVTWASSHRTEVNVRLGLGSGTGRALSTVVRRRSVPRPATRSWFTMDVREHSLCRLIAERITQVLELNPEAPAPKSLAAIRRQFDENIVVDFLRDHHELELDLGQVFLALHELAEQTYENAPLAFGCVLDPTRRVDGDEPTFPLDLLRSKRYRALSDGYRTAYHVSTNGHVMDFVALGKNDTSQLGQRLFFPFWAEDIARASRNRSCGIALTTHGDILVFDEGNLALTYRFGRWQLWSHSSLCALLRDLMRGQRVPLQTTTRLAKAVYRAALDASFRRKGALFVVLSRAADCDKVVRQEDRIDDPDRSPVDRQFDGAIKRRILHALPREIVSEFASLDGAIVTRRNGELLAYGAVLQPRRQGKLRGSEGSRTKAAIGASNYGIAVKVSSDGQITIFRGGEPFLAIGSTTS